MRCNYDPFSDEDPADLSFPFNPDSPIQEQVANLIFRFSEYRKAHRHMNGCLNTISSEHYKVCDSETLLKLKQPIQVLLYARETLQKMDEAFERDIKLCNQFLSKLQEIENGPREDTLNSSEDFGSDC